MDRKSQTITPPIAERQAIIQEALRIQAEQDYRAATAYLMHAGIEFADALHILLSKQKNR